MSAMIKIKHKTTGKVLWTVDADTLKGADLIFLNFKGAGMSGLDLSGADLFGANMRGANMRGANMSLCDLSECDLRECNLSEADLRGANMRGANMSGANMRGANMRGANMSLCDLSECDLRECNLSEADLRSENMRGANMSECDLSECNLIGANMRGANMRGANLRGANMIGANMRGANLTGVKIDDDIPVVPNIDKAILAAVTEDGQSLDMGDWHTCSTTHCRAGWAIHLAGDAGYALAWKVGSAVAGTLIYLASRPGKNTPDFYCTNEEAMADLIACAAEKEVVP
jgi:uncharacterized protein YjbI with pentapeptide repeats